MIAGFLSAASPAAAAEWRIADVAIAGTTFIDATSIRRDGDTVTFSTWTVTTRAVGRAVDNWRTTTVARCADGRYRDVSIQYLSGPKLVEQSQDEPERVALADTMAGSKVAVACGAKRAGPDIVRNPYRYAKSEGRKRQRAVVVEER